MTTVAPPTLDVDEVRAALQPRAVLDFYGWKTKKSGDEFESAACPARPDHSRRAFLINSSSGRWRCFPCATKGDLFDFIAALEKLSVRTDFGAVLAKAAEIAGVGPSTLTSEERAQKRAEWHKRLRDAEQREREERRRRDEAAVPTSTKRWALLDKWNDRGAEYLRARGIDPAAVVPEVVRFDPRFDGAPSIALYSFTGEIHNVVVRRFPEEGEPKTRGIFECPALGTFISSTNDIEPNSDVFVVEGVFDAITARVAWPKGIVLGAHGGENIPEIVRRAALIVAKTASRMHIVSHQDKAGHKAAVAAGTIALDAGLSIRRGTLRIVRHPHKDLNDAWQRGWRPT